MTRVGLPVWNAYCLLYTSPPISAIPLLLGYKVMPSIYEPDFAIQYAEAADAYGIRAPYHLAVNTGMNRIGVRYDQVVEFLNQVSFHRALDLVGTFTHFATADAAETLDFHIQTKRFLEALSGMRAAGVDPGIIHAANSAATIRYPDVHFDMVRPGIALYGLHPCQETRHLIELHPVMSVHARVTDARLVPMSEGVSYGMNYRSPGSVKICTIPVGYADGLRRGLSGRTDFIVAGQRLDVYKRQAFLVPLVFVPLCGLCIALSVREMRLDQPMFEDVPRDHPRVYRQVVVDYWRSALAVGALAFASGVIRGVALLHQELAAVVNSASMLGALASAAVLLVLWFRMSFRFGMTTVFRVVYPLVITGFLLLPWLGAGYLNLFAAFTYLVFSLVQMLMMMQCAQISRDRGINPVFIYGFFGGVAYLMQSAGFLLGWMSDFASLDGLESLFAVAMVSSWVLGLTLLASTGTLFKPLASRGTLAAEPIEFMMPEPSAVKTGKAAKAKEKTRGKTSREGAEPPKKRRNRPSATADAGAIRDRVSKQCLQLQHEHGLSLRETEVMELIARGNSMASIAERLVISENTVRTHAKHIYTKLDIHKRQELLDMLADLEG